MAYGTSIPKDPEVLLNMKGGSVETGHEERPFGVLPELQMWGLWP